MTPVSNRRVFLRSCAALAGSETGLCAGRSEVSRMERCCEIRSTAAAFYKSQQQQRHPTNGDELLFPNGAASFSKALPHDSRGEPLHGTYDRLVSAVRGGSFHELESVLLGGNMKLSNPLGENAFELEGPDSHQLGMPAPPAFSSPEQAGEMVELYWQAVTRDIPFSRWADDETIGAAIDDLNAREVFRGPTLSGRVTAQTLFRIDAPGVLDGPYVSQLLLQPLRVCDQSIPQQYISPTPGRDFAFLYKDWLALQNGVMPMEELEFEAASRSIRTARALTGLVHDDYTFQAFLCAALILSRLGNRALSKTNPYKSSRTQVGFVTFGEPHVIDCMARAANASLKAAWYQKWLVHRRIRPEEFSFRVHKTLLGDYRYPIAGDLAKSAVLSRIESSTSGLMLPMAYPEGCPIHPSYPAGHAVIAGACTTILKAFFDEDFEIPHPVTGDLEGAGSIPYEGKLRAGGELNKLASNIGMARNAAGVHWRSDTLQGIRLGETVAIGLLRDIAATGSEPFFGFQFTNFDGELTTIRPSA